MFHPSNLVSSFQSCSSCHFSRFGMFHLFFSGVPSFPLYLVAKLHLNHCKASPCVFKFSFFLPSFYYRSSSWRLYMFVRQGILFILQLFFKISLEVMIHQAILKIKHGAQHMFCFEELKYLYLAFRSAIVLPYHLRWCYVTLDNFLHVSWFICCQEWGILNPSFSLCSRDPFYQSIYSWSYLGLYFT